MKASSLFLECTNLSTYILTLVVLTSCSPISWWGRNPPSSTQHLPIYPRAAQVVEQTNGSVRLVSFVTHDKPEDVLTYYTDILTKDGWQLDVIPLPLTPVPKASDALYFSWYGEPGDAGYKLDLIVKPSTISAESNVEIKLVIDIGR